MIQDYVTAQSAEQTVALLQSLGGKARLMAGGTDLVLDLQSGKYTADCLVDISRIPELARICLSSGIISVGAAVTHNEAAQSPLLCLRASALAKASLSVGSHQIRNSSTISGNIVNAQPAADTAVALVALGARARILSAEGEEYLPVEELYAGFGKSKVDSTSSLLAEILVPAAVPGQGSGYERLQQRRALALPMLCVGAMVSLRGDEIEWARISMAPVGIGPVRAKAAEDYLAGRTLCAESLEAAGKLALEDANPRDSLVRGSREYRLEVLPSLVSRALAEAVADAQKPGKEAEIA